MTSRIHIEPEYTCEGCGSPMTSSTVKYRTVLNNHQYVFCRIGCYYTWAEGADLPYEDEEQYNR